MERVILPERLCVEGVARIEAAMTVAVQAEAPLVLEGACAGMDANAVLLAPGGARQALQRYADLLLRLRGLPVPTLAMVRGPVLGGGLGLVAACEIVLAAPDARFGLPEALIGLVPGMVWPVLSERVRPARLRRLALEGAAIGAAEAVAIGLADVESTAVDAWLRRLSRADRRSRAWIKRHELHAPVQAGLEQTLSALGALDPEAVRTADPMADGGREAPWRR